MNNDIKPFVLFIPNQSDDKKQLPITPIIAKLKKKTDRSQEHCEISPKPKLVQMDQKSLQAGPGSGDLKEKEDMDSDECLAGEISVNKKKVDKLQVSGSKRKEKMFKNDSPKDKKYCGMEDHMEMCKQSFTINEPNTDEQTDPDFQSAEDSDSDDSFASEISSEMSDDVDVSGLNQKVIITENKRSNQKMENAVEMYKQSFERCKPANFVEQLAAESSESDEETEKMAKDVCSSTEDKVLRVVNGASNVQLLHSPELLPKFIIYRYGSTWKLKQKHNENVDESKVASSTSEEEEEDEEDEQ